MPNKSSARKRRTVDGKRRASRIEVRPTWNSRNLFDSQAVKREIVPIDEAVMARMSHTGVPLEDIAFIFAIGLSEVRSHIDSYYTRVGMALPTEGATVQGDLMVMSVGGR